MRKGGRKVTLACAAIVFAGVTSAAGPVLAANANTPAEAAARSPQAALENKTRLVKLLLAQSPAVQRIPQSGNAQAKKKLAEAQALYAKAADEAAGGRTDAAIKLLDEALREIVSASRLVPDPAQAASQERSRYAAMIETVRTFAGLHQNVSARMAAKNVQASAKPLDPARVNGMMEKAEALAAGGNHKDANALLNGAYKELVASLNRMLLAETIVYDLKFDTPADEFRHELARNRSYEELVPLAVAQLNVPRETALLAERYVQQGRSLREQAQKQGSGGDYAAALKTIQDATGQIQRALRIAGLIVPQSTEDKP